MRVLFLVSYPKLAASSRTRVYQFLPLLQKEGVKCKSICFTSLEMYRFSLTLNRRNFLIKLAYYSLVLIIRIFKMFQSILMAHSYDIISIQKLIFPFGLERILKTLNRNIIFEFDDAIFVSGKDEKELIGKMKIKFQNNSFKRMLKVAKCCIVENEYNKNIALRYCPWVEKITGPIDTKRNFPAKKRRKENNIVIGWIGSPHTTKYLYDIKDVFKELSRRYRFILRVIGSEKEFRIEGVNCELKEWSLEEEVRDLQGLDIGIMPLLDNEYTRGKGGYKLLQYMSVGICPIASPVEINKEIIEDGVNGFLAEAHEEWIRKLSILIEDKELKEKMGRRARKTIEEHYALDKAVKMLVQIFERMMKGCL